jgi:UDP-glucose 4-epimerase
MSKISVVTGCAGFIGSHMTEFLLKKKHFVYGIDNLASGKIKNLKNFRKDNKFKFVKSDVKNFNNIIKKNKIKKIDYFFHFAGHGELIPSIKNPLKYFENNSFKTAIVMDTIKKKFKLKKFIYAASSSCYGITNKKTRESNKIKIEHPYAFSKYIGEQICLHWAKIYKIPVISIRIFNAYGPRSRTNNVYGAVIGVFLKQKLSNHPLTVIGNGKQKRDFLYISDLCEAFHKASISKYNYEIFNLGSSKPNSINYLASLISNNKKYIPWRQGEPFKTDANINKIKKYLKWKPEVSLKSGIEIVKNNIYYWKNAPLWTKKKIYLATKLWNKCLKKKKY